MVNYRSDVAHALFAAAIAAFACYRARRFFAEAYGIEVTGVVAYPVYRGVEVLDYLVLAYRVCDATRLPEPSVLIISPLSVSALAEERNQSACAAD